jgi:hypothetical protein
MIAKLATMKQPLLNNGSANKQVSTTREDSNNGGDVFYAVTAEIL